MYKLCKIIFREVTYKNNIPAEIVYIRNKEKFPFTMIIIVLIFFGGDCLVRYSFDENFFLTLQQSCILKPLLLLIHACVLFFIASLS